MNTEKMMQFDVLDMEALEQTLGGANIGAEFIGAAWVGCGFGASIGGLGGCIIGAQYIPVMWTAIRLK